MICFSLLNGNDYDKCGINGYGLQKTILLLNELKSNLKDKYELLSCFKIILNQQDCKYFFINSDTNYHIDKFLSILKSCNINSLRLKNLIIDEYLNFNEDDSMVLLEQIITKT